MHASSQSQTHEQALMMMLYGHAPLELCGRFTVGLISGQTSRSETVAPVVQPETNLYSHVPLELNG